MKTMDKLPGLYRRFLGGDNYAFVRIIELTSDKIVYYVLGFVGNYSDAEELMMESFETLVIKRPKLRSDGAFLSYLYKIAKSRVMTHYRKRKRTLPLETAWEVPDTVTPEDLLERDERSAAVHAALKKLSPDYREVIYLEYFAGLSIKECAAVMKKSVKQVYNLSARAKSAMKKILGKEYDNELFTEE